MYKTITDVERVISLGKNETVIEHFAESYLQGLEYEAWLDTQKSAHATAYPEKIDGDEILDEDNNPTGEFEQVDNPDYIDFDTYMAETEQVEVGSKDILDEDGITVIGTEPVYEDRLIREYSEVVVDVEAWKATAPEYGIYLEKQKDDLLNGLEVTISTGKTFYADPESRDDILTAIILGDKKLTSKTYWKLAKKMNGVEPITGTDKVYEVTKDELIEALEIALTAKGQIVGAV